MVGQIVVALTRLKVVDPSWDGTSPSDMSWEKPSCTGPYSEAQLLWDFHGFSGTVWEKRSGKTVQNTILVGGWATPLKNMSSSVGMMIPNIWKNKSHVPNHQPAIGHVRILPRIHMNSAYICIQAAHVGGMVWVKKKLSLSLSLSPIESRSNWLIHIINISNKNILKL